MVVGVSEGYKKELEVNGVGYKAAKQGKKLVLSLGYSHPVEWKIQKVLSPQLMETRSSYLVSAKKKSASLQLRSETREDLSHTRARESSTLTKLSDVKSVRPVRNN